MVFGVYKIMNLVLGFCGKPTKEPHCGMPLTPLRNNVSTGERAQLPTSGGTPWVAEVFVLVWAGVCEAVE